MNGAESLLRSLHSAGVEVCFANPGTSEMQFVDALDRTGLMRCVLGLFEGVVSGAADGYARMAGKPAATLLHLAPGLANAGANLHNARKARTPMLNIVGDHARRHLRYDAPLTADVPGTAAAFSDWVRTVQSSETIAGDAMDALAAAWGHPGQISTLIVPADIGWEPVAGVEPAERAKARAPRGIDDDMLRRAASSLGPDAVILCGGNVLESPDAMARLAGIAAKTDTRLFASGPLRRMERGNGRHDLPRVPYPVDDALAALSGFRRAILIEALPPVAFFAYPDRPSLLLPEDCETVPLADFDQDGPAAIEALADLVGTKPAPPRNSDPCEPPQAGPMDDAHVSAAIAAALPEDAIVVDERLTSATRAMPLSAEGPPISWLAITGGAIGIGVPLATGAGVACPDRPVVALQADGSSLYTIQALWSQAREGLNVTTVIFANRGYQILKQELFKVGQNPGPGALDMLELDRPVMDFVSIAKGFGVPGKQVSCPAELYHTIRTAAAEPGPFLIEAVL
ncbi:acetolactate synthase large subunit [Roseovarius sp. SCSIO 43702]|uniref:acetolactate synthase large subunit n=1 Tax=Roseovarius sp. SCSIO 43702 TaxID=2823043 RepID=UPI001C72C100|nr:acetolactate synthase large subunit [Roseovarius sp. SCSIO 43702]QYX57189.1 acetolactate synthase large subunit [Roseovarius sp. SCSIO 43702]